MDQYFFANAVFSKFSKNYMDLKKGLPIRPSEMGVLNILADTNAHLADLMAALGQEGFEQLVKLTEKANQTLETKRGDKHDQGRTL